MKVSIELDGALYSSLRRHLFPTEGLTEEAAFLFVVPEITARATTFRVVESHFASPAEFATREADFLELSDEARRKLIKRAHDLSASIAEIHSHRGPWKAAFSSSDRAGLRETVPHMWWRLKGRPYLALVFASDSFDALVWIENPNMPRKLDALRIGEESIVPANNSLGGWGNGGTR